MSNIYLVRVDPSQEFFQKNKKDSDYETLMAYIDYLEKYLEHDCQFVRNEVYNSTSSKPGDEGQDLYLKVHTSHSCIQTLTELVGENNILTENDIDDSFEKVILD